MKLIEMYTKNDCPWCTKAYDLLLKHYDGRAIMVISNISENPNLKTELLKRYSDAKTVPQIFFDKEHIGGYDDLVEYIDNTTSLG